MFTTQEDTLRKQWKSIRCRTESHWKSENTSFFFYFIFLTFLFFFQTNNINNKLQHRRQNRKTTMVKAFFPLSLVEKVKMFLLLLRNYNVTFKMNQGHKSWKRRMPTCLSQQSGHIYKKHFVPVLIIVCNIHANRQLPNFTGPSCPVNVKLT